MCYAYQGCADHGLAPTQVSEDGLYHSTGSVLILHGQLPRLGWVTATAYCSFSPLSAVLFPVPPRRPRCTAPPPRHPRPRPGGVDMLWDGSETIEQYAKRTNLEPTRTLDLGTGIKMEMVFC